MFYDVLLIFYLFFSDVLLIFYLFFIDVLLIFLLFFSIDVSIDGSPSIGV